MSVVDFAMEAVKSFGLSVLAVGGPEWTMLDDKTGLEISLNKKPVYISANGPRLALWERFQESPPEVFRIPRMFANIPAVGVICGKVSGNLEVIDFDAEGYFEKWSEVLKDHGYEDLLDRLMVQETQSRGHFHVIYRCPEGIGGHKSLASRYTTDEERLIDPKQKEKELIETRGEGNYFVAHPSPGYTVLRGSFGNIPVVTSEERGLLHAAASYLTEVVAPEGSNRPVPRDKLGRNTDLRPGDVFNAETGWEQIIAPFGWKFARHVRDRAEWVRPGKEIREGISAVSGLGRNGQDLLHVFTSNGAPLPCGESISKFRAYSLLNHDGDDSAAAREIAKKFGMNSKPKNEAVGDTDSSMVERVRENPPIDLVEPEGGAAIPYFKPIKWSELKLTPHKKMLVEGFLGVGDSGMLVGTRKAGKTGIIVDLTLSMINARIFADRFEVAQPLSVAYFTTEGRTGIPQRVLAANTVHQVPDELLETHFHFFPVLPQLYIEDHPGYFEELIPVFNQMKIDVFIIDTFSKATLGANENQSTEMNRCLYNLSKIREETGATSLVNHHANRAGGARGSTAVDADMDVQVWVDWDEETGDRKMRFGFAKDMAPWEDVPFGIYSVEDGVAGSMRIVWDPTKQPEQNDALSQVLRLMSGDPSMGWWPLGLMVDELGLNYDAVRMACKRMCGNDGCFDSRQIGRALEFRLRSPQ